LLFSLRERSSKCSDEFISNRNAKVQSSANRAMDKNVTTLQIMPYEIFLDESGTSLPIRDSVRMTGCLLIVRIESPQQHFLSLTDSLVSDEITYLASPTEPARMTCRCDLRKLSAVKPEG
jgi:GTP-sensing pleiotropic transcriptional regulator CodY